MSEIALYQDDNSSIEVLLEQDTLWISQEHMALLFQVQKAAISKHLKNIYASGELERAATVSKMETVQQEGLRKVTRQIDHFNLDAVISVGYRVNSARATRFRQWATGILRGHLTRDFALNRQRFETNARALEATLQLAKKAAQTPLLAADTGRGLVDIITRYTQTFLLLQRYDEGLLTEPRQQAGGILPTVDEARQMLIDLKADLMARGEATSLFAQERGDGLAALLGNLDQTVFGDPPTRALKPRRRICSISSSRIIPLPTVTNAAALLCLSTSSTATIACSTTPAPRFSTIWGWPRWPFWWRNPTRPRKRPSFN